MTEPGEVADNWARRVIGAAIEVHSILGAGFLEATYEEAMAVELANLGIPFIRQAPVALNYKGHPVGQARIDFIVDDILVVELKAVETFAPIHQAQVINYLKATGYPLGLLINFNTVKLADGGIKRIVLTS